MVVCVLLLFHIGEASVNGMDNDVKAIVIRSLASGPGQINMQRDYATASVITDILVHKFKLPICFENIARDPKTESISAQEAYNELTAKQQLNPAETAELKRMSELIKTTPEIVVGWKEPEYNLRYSAKPAWEVIEDLFGKLEKEFNIHEENSYIIITPKNGSFLLGRVENVEIANKTLGDGLKDLLPVWVKYNVSPTEVGGPEFDFKINRLRLHDVTLMELVTRLAQATTPPTIWSLRGMRGARMLVFETLGK